MNSKPTVGDGFKFGLGFTFGSFVASVILIPIFVCGGFVVMTLLGGTLGALLGSVGP
ncbi:MAG: hypothetical protein Kow0031_15760 [Anaerolineae bacterium]